MIKPANKTARYVAIEAYRKAIAKGMTPRGAHSRATSAAIKVLGTSLGAWDCSTWAQAMCEAARRLDVNDYTAPEALENYVLGSVQS